MLMVSVIIPIYNSEKKLCRCVDSVLSQTYTDFELILVDDGSTDSTPQICDDYALKDKRIKVIHKSNEGVSAARNDGIKIAKGNYITFVDSDDYIDPIFLERALDFVEKYSADVYICGILFEKWLNNQIISKRKYGNAQIKKYSAKTLLEANETDYPLINISGPCCKLFPRKKLINNNIFFNEEMSRGEDSDFNLQVINSMDSFVFDSETFYHYTFNEGETLFNSYRNDIYEITASVYGNMYDTMIRKQCSKKSIITFKNMYVGLMIGCIHHYYIYRKKNNNKERSEIISKISKDELFCKCRISQISSIKNKILTLLLKTKLFFCIKMLFSVYYINRQKR